jgi:hypothetical protein
MGWGDTFSDAWNSATDTARAAANAIADTATAAYDAVVDARNEAIDRAIDTVSSIVDYVIDARDRAINRALDRVISGFQAIYDAFGRLISGGAVQPCPRGGSGGGTTPPGPSETPPPPPVEDYNIVSVEWLHGDDITVIGNCDQYVNLPRDAKWLADSGIANIDRLGIKPRLLVKFDKPISAGFRYRIVPFAGGSPAYTATEEGRNSNFKASPSDWSNGSVSNGQGIIDDVQLVAGGGYTFQVEAKDDKNKSVLSGIITTKRLFWYVKLPMTGLTNVLSATGTIESEFAKYHMVLKKLPDLAIPRQENIDLRVAADQNLLGTNVNNAVAGNAAAAAKAPHLLRLTFTDYLSSKNPNQRQRKIGVRVGPGQPAAAIAVTAPALQVPNTVAPRALWNNIVTGEGWFVSASYTPDGGGAAIPIGAAQVTSPDAGPSLVNLAVDVTGLPAGTGTIDVYVNVVDFVAAGLALPGAGNICVCTRANWANYGQAEQACTVVHEIGHKIQMVTKGTGIQPDKVATHYEGCGHYGDHCHNGAPAGQADYGTRDNVTKAACVMFGTINGQIGFCGNCGPAVKKVDIGGGF